MRTPSAPPGRLRNVGCTRRDRRSAQRGAVGPHARPLADHVSGVVGEGALEAVPHPLGVGVTIELVEGGAHRRGTVSAPGAMLLVGSAPPYGMTGEEFVRRLEYAAAEVELVGELLPRLRRESRAVRASAASDSRSQSRRARRVPSASSNWMRWARSHRANASSIAVASWANERLRAVAKMRPGLGQNSPPAPDELDLDPEPGTSHHPVSSRPACAPATSAEHALRQAQPGLRTTAATGAP